MDSLILEKDNSENQARQYSSHKHVANLEWWANHKKKKKDLYRTLSISKMSIINLLDVIDVDLLVVFAVSQKIKHYRNIL